MFQSLTHPISGILASVFAFVSTLPQDISLVIQCISAALGLLIAVLSAITAIENFRNRKKK